MVRALAEYGRPGKWIALGCFLSLSCTQPAIGTFGRQFDIRADSVYDESWNTPLPPGVPTAAGAFRTMVAPYLVYTGPTYVRLRAGKCRGCVINVSIKTLSSTRSLDPDSPPPRGRPIARIQNLDRDTTEAYYGFKPGRSAEYFWWVDSSQSHPGFARVTMLEVPWFGSVKAGLQKDIQLCSPYSHEPRSPSEGADFVEYRHPEGCNPRADHLSVKHASVSFPYAWLWSIVAARVTTIFSRNTMLSGGGWIDCNSGCCT